jgi:hypothetical protein
MREHGVEMPDPVIRRFDGGSSGVVGGGTEEVPAGELPFDPNSDEFQAAEEACDEHLQGLGAMEPGSAPQLSAEEEEAFLAFTECMRENGIDLPDPGTGGTIEIGPDTGFDPGSDDFRAAEEECRSHLQGVMGGDGGFVEPAP